MNDGVQYDARREPTRESNGEGYISLHIEMENTIDVQNVTETKEHERDEESRREAQREVRDEISLSLQVRDEISLFPIIFLQPIDRDENKQPVNQE
jgi:hypothetical protein